VRAVWGPLSSREVIEWVPEKRDSVLLEVLLILIQHSIEPRKQLFSAVVGVKDDGDAVNGSHSTNVMSTGNGTSDARLLVLVGDSLPYAPISTQAIDRKEYRQSRRIPPGTFGG